MQDSHLSIPPREPFFLWSDELSVGHQGVDADHQHIFDIANRLHRAIADEVGESIVGDILYELIVYTQEHFRREESYMLTIRYEGLAAHRHEHNLLLHKVGRLHQDYLAGRENLGIDVLDFLRQWLFDHIMHTDMEMVRHARNHHAS